MRRPTLPCLLLALAALSACDGPKAPPPAADAGKMVMAEDAAGGYRLAVPEGWTRLEFGVADPRKRWFSGGWGPAAAGVQVEGMFAHLMAPGVQAADFGGRIAGQAVATLDNPQAYAPVGGGAGSVAGRPAYRLEAKYKAQLGEIFEASAYVETGPGVGVLVTHRVSAGQEALARARLDASLAAFEPLPRTLKLGEPSRWPGGIRIAVPAGFDAWQGPAPRSVAANCLGPIDGDRQETISLLVVPAGPDAQKLQGSLLAQAAKNLTPGEPREIGFAGGKAQAVLYSPKAEGARYETAIAGAPLGGAAVALVVSAAMNPPGRALAVLEAVAPTIAWEAEPVELETAPRGDDGLRVVPLPRGWEPVTEPGFVGALRTEALPPDAAGGEPKKRTLQLVQVAFEEDLTGAETPKGKAEALQRMADPKKATPLGVEELALADGRAAARVTVMADGGVDVIGFVRIAPGAIAQVRVMGLPGFAAESQRLNLEMLAAVRYARLEEQAKPADAVIEASRGILPALVERARGAAAAENLYAYEQDGKVAGGARIARLAGGRWNSLEVRVMERKGAAAPGKPPQVVERATITNRVDGGPDGTREDVTIEAWTPRKTATHACVTTLSAGSGAWLDVLRTPKDGEPRQDRLARTDLLIPPDVQSSDQLFIALASAPEGTYAFHTIAEGTLVVRWREFRVKGEEEVQVGAQKMRARRVEAGQSTVVWVEGGRVVRADASGYVRRLAEAEEVKDYIK